MITRRHLLITVSLAAALLWTTGGVCSPTQVEVFRVHYRNAEELLPIVHTLLSPQGRATADFRTNSLVVIDTAESIRGVRKFLDRMDRPLQQFRIEVRFDAQGTTQERELGADGTLSGDGWKISVGDSSKDGIHLKAKDRQISGSEGSGYFIIATQGTPAYIRIGTDIPYQQGWYRLCRKYAGCVTETVFHRVETGFDVTPVPAGNQVELDITPRISDADTDGTIRFAGASTRLAVPLGQWVTVGGGDGTSNEALQAILKAGRENESKQQSISLKVERYP